jgi:hypothetical protein
MAVELPCCSAKPSQPATVGWRGGDSSNRVSLVPVALDHDHGADARREHILALQ